MLIYLSTHSNPISKYEYLVLRRLNLKLPDNLHSIGIHCNLLRLHHQVPVKPCVSQLMMLNKDKQRVLSNRYAAKRRLLTGRMHTIVKSPFLYCNFSLYKRLKTKQGYTYNDPFVRFFSYVYLNQDWTHDPSPPALQF
jgi:hypothetical protein